MQRSGVFCAPANISWGEHRGLDEMDSYALDSNTGVMWSSSGARAGFGSPEREVRSRSAAFMKIDYDVHGGTNHSHQQAFGGLRPFLSSTRGPIVRAYHAELTGSTFR